MLSIFFDFGNLGSGSIFYLDSVYFGTASGTIFGCTNPTATNYDPLATVDDGSCTYPALYITTTVCDTSASEVRLTGPWWSWDPMGGPVAADNGDGTWTFTFNPAPTADMEYLLVVDGVQEDMVASGNASGNWSCTPITDYWSYANRLWTVGSGDVTGIVYGTCDSCVAAPAAPPALALQGILDFTVPSGGSDGKAIHVVATDNIADLSVYGIGVANNGGGTDGQEYNFDAISVSAGDDILVVRSVSAMSSYFDACYTEFDHVLLGTTAISQNGDDAIELFYNGNVIETFGDINVDGTGQPWEYMDSWAYKDSSGTVSFSGGNWIFGGVNCTDGSTTTFNSTCPYPLCPLPIFGCTDPTALNYDSTATIDDGSCIAGVYGCTDPAAINYYPGANLDDGSCCYVAGCTDPTAANYDPAACIDDGSCTYSTTCSASPITNLGVTDIIHNRATFTFDDMNTSTCRVDQLRIKYREVGTTAWSQKNMGSPTGYDPVTGICNSTSRTDKLVLGLSANTTYEWQMRVWYCSTGATAWVNGPNFTTLADCPNVGNLAVTTPTNTKATFTWDNSNGAYSFVRLQARVDTTGSSFFNIGGVGVPYGTYTKDKNGLVPGTSYRAKSRTWCDPNGGAYKAPSWTTFIYFTMPGSVRLDGGTSIDSLDVYPNPSRDIFNVSFTSEDAQDLEVRVINVVGEVVYTENLMNFTGEYTKEIDLRRSTKGIYFLEITTEDGVINKKMILQ